MTAAVDVDARAELHRLEDQRVHLAVGRDEGARMLGERMRDDVAGIEQRNHIAEHAVGIDPRAGLVGPELAQVNVDWHPRFPRRLLAEAKRLDAPARVATDLRVALDAPDDVAMGLDGASRLTHVDAVRTGGIDGGVSGRAANEVVGDEREHPGLGSLHDELLEPLKRERPGSALIDERRHAGPNADLVGIHPEIAGHVLVHVRVGVDHAGQDQTATHVQAPTRTPGDSGRDFHDAAVADADVECSVDAPGRIDHAAATKNQIHRIHVSSSALHPDPASPTDSWQVPRNLVERRSRLRYTVSERETTAWPTNSRDS